VTIQLTPRSEARAIKIKRFEQAAARVLLRTAIGMFCLAALASIVVIVAGEFGSTEGRILLSALSIAAYSLAGLVATARFGRKPVWVPALGLGAAGIGLALMLITIWSGFEGDLLARFTISVMVVVIALAHANLLLPIPGREDPALRILLPTILVSAILTVMIVWPVLFDRDIDSSLYWKFLAVVAILLVLGTLVVPIVRKINAADTTYEPEPIVANPFWLRTLDETLEVFYRGHAFEISAEPTSGDQQEFMVRAWTRDGKGKRQLSLGSSVPAGDDRHVVLGAAVQEITRSVDAQRNQSPGS
jgi:hypothetical protein